MFQRRRTPSYFTRLMDFFWPSIGWKRSFLYIKHRLIRLSDSTHKIALGLAIGSAISFTPIVGTHFIQAAAAAYLARANLLSAVVGTFIGNPWTFPFMWWVAISFGSFLFHLMGLPSSTALPDEMNFAVLWELITHEPLRIFLPWMLGGYIAALISIPFTYMVFYRLIGAAKHARARARIRKLHKTAKEVTGQPK